MLAESACIPVPSELTMLFAGALSAGAVAGAHLNLVLAIAAGVAGNVAGSYLAWGVGAYGRRAAWHRWGRYILLRDDDIDWAERWFGRHGARPCSSGACCSRCGRSASTVAMPGTPGAAGMTSTASTAGKSATRSLRARHRGHRGHGG